MAENTWVAPQGFWVQGIVSDDVLVSEIWYGNQVVGEVRPDGDKYIVVIYPAQDGAFWTFPTADFCRIIEFAQHNLARKSDLGGRKE